MYEERKVPPPPPPKTYTYASLPDLAAGSSLFRPQAYLLANEVIQIFTLSCYNLASVCSKPIRGIPHRISLKGLIGKSKLNHEVFKSVNALLRESESESERVC